MTRKIQGHNHTVVPSCLGGGGEPCIGNLLLNDKITSYVCKFYFIPKIIFLRQIICLFDFILLNSEIQFYIEFSNPFLMYKFPNTFMRKQASFFHIHLKVVEGFNLKIKLRLRNIFGWNKSS